MRSLRSTAVAVFSVVLLSGACAPVTSSNYSLPDELFPNQIPPATVQVTNNNWSNMTVYAVRGNARFRLGMVTSMSTAEFRLSPALSGGATGLRLLADPIGGSETFITPAIHLNDGDVVKFDIQNQLSISSVSIFDRR